MAIQRINRIKVENYSEDILKKATDKSIEGNNFLQEANKVSPNGELLVQALNSFEESINIYSRFPDPYLGISWIFHISGDNKKAISFILNALEIDPRNPLALELHEKYQQDLKTNTISRVANKALGKSDDSPVNVPEKRTEPKKINSLNVKQNKQPEKINAANNFLSSYKK